MNTSTIIASPQDQFERNIKIEEILMPSARKRRNDAYKNQPIGQFAHYTSAEAALSIIKNKELWLRNTTCMNDYMEVEHGYKQIHSFFNNKDYRSRFDTALDKSHHGIGEEALKLFDQWWSNIRYGSFIASVSEHNSTENQHGRLSMWRGFGGSSARVAIVVNIPWKPKTQNAPTVMFSPVSYASQDEAINDMSNACLYMDESSEFLKTIPRQELLNYLFSMLINGVTCSKHEGFHEEREWRLLYSPEISNSSQIKKSTESVNGVPQIVYKLPFSSKNPELGGSDLSDIVDRIIIGPSPYPWAMYQAFVDTLKEAGISNAEERVFVSGIPIR